jgi:hypothetical protein
MSFWAIFSLILIFFGASSAGILLVLKSIEKKNRLKYSFYSEDGEEIPLGI